MSSSIISSFSPTAAIENYFKTNGDKRVAELRFMDNPWEILLISIFYVYFCYDLGPHRLMKNRKPFDLVWMERAFNTFILLLNVWLLKRHFSLLNWGYDSLGCSPVSENDRSAKALEHINICHIFLYSRISELVDTLWICLRKKNRQITFLHVFRHTFVLLMTWFYVKLAPGGSTAMFPIVNGIVHTIMYAYYILSTFDSVKPFLWWKKYVTTIQLIQFIILGLHFAVAALTPNCGYPRTLSLTGVAIAGIFFALFYKETYTRQQQHFDDFSAYPVDFKWSQARDQRPPAPYKKSFPAHSNEPSSILDGFILKLPLELVISVIMKTIGRRLIYPGSLGFLQAIMYPAIVSGRSRLIEEHGGIRHKLESYDGNFIDTMFVDRRGATPNGDYLVIGCEGNGGFYEIGTILTPLESGYSVLGWNHPGFGGSTGTPYPDQDVAAVDTVVKFAMDGLRFAPSQIVLYGWSIGGFTATWAGMRHPNIHGIVIDASFDHILPLAKNMFPGFIYPIIEMAIRQHFDLDNSRHLENYKGPVLLIRRSQDEVIATDPYNSPPTNRANNLLMDLLKQRFPELIDYRAIELLKEFLGGNSRYQDGILRKYSVNSTDCLRVILDYLQTHPTSYPISIGDSLDNTTRDQLVLFLASKHIIDYDSVHCAPLPARYFHRPWNLIGLAMNSSKL